MRHLGTIGGAVSHASVVRHDPPRPIPPDHHLPVPGFGRFFQRGARWQTAATADIGFVLAEVFRGGFTERVHLDPTALFKKTIH
ncbi:hypothetical protein D3C72_2315100 [compost metagenome]